MKKVILALVAIVSLSAQASDRTWVLSGDSLINILLANDVSSSAGGGSSTLSTQVLQLQGGINMGWYELGPILTYRNEDDGSTVTKTSGFGAYGKYNFVENKNGVTMVPFAKLQLETNTKKVSGNSSDNFSYLIGAGASFFPFNDIIAIDGLLAYRNAKEKTGTVDITRAGFALGTAFNLYF